MRIYKLEVPVTNYRGDSVFFQEFFFFQETTPTKDQAIKLLEKARDEHFADFAEELEVIKSCQEFPMCWPGISFINTRVQHPKWGDQPISMAVITPLNTYPESEISFSISG